ncbi:LOW QUALITY PROTEIN: RNA polymerase I termination factor-like [Medicago truncatula]|uniref:LOW QUALITY PROTEIN: RNA polymerase I termination factor-like n=1 Tax=Medicago truncatula TaxID=3880 RepID=UPI000D2F2A14|nr:LOW QUALITY PROTEIN: RNA polymerase I termination factor-like [Medicago truncatula]
MKTPSKKNKRTEDEEGETNGGDPNISESNVTDLPLIKRNDDQHLIKSNKSEDGEQGKKKKKKKKLSEESNHKKYNEFNSNECEDDDQGKKMKKKRKLIEGNALEEGNGFRSNEGDNGEQGKKKKKKKKLNDESKHKEYNEFKSNECEADDQGKKMKKKLIEGNTLMECNDFRSNDDEDGEREKKMKKKKKKPSEESTHKEYSEFKSNECEDDQGKKTKKKHKLIEGSTLTECNDFRSNGGEEGEQDKKMKKKKKKLSEESKRKEYSKFELTNECEDDDGQGKKMKKKLIEEAKVKEYSDIISNISNEGGNPDQGKTKKNKPSQKKKNKENNDFNSKEGDAVTEVNDQGKKMKKKKKAKTVTSESPNCAHNETPSNKGDADACFSVTDVNDQGKKMKKKKKAKTVTSESPNSAHNGTSKRKQVTWADEVEEKLCCDGLLRGKRYTPEEDEKIKAAVFDYIDSHGLGDEGLDMVLNVKLHPEVSGCWKEIAKGVPERPYESVYRRAHTLLEKEGRCKWTPEELEFIEKTYEQHGASLRAVADALGKSRAQVKDAWRRLKYTKAKKGHWSQEEYQKLFNLVNLDLLERAKEPYKKSQPGMLRDNICWEAIGHKLETRNSAFCCKKWYEQLTSTMVASGDWCDTDDFRLINALYALDACCMEEVDWDNLVEHRSGDVCRKRWEQMIHHIGEHAAKSFIEQVEVLAKRFCPNLLEDREAFDNKPVIC